MEVDRRLCSITFNYQHCFLLLPITLTVAWQLLLVSCNAKIIQLLYFNISCKVLAVPYMNGCVGSWGKYHCVNVFVINFRCMLDSLWDYPVLDKSNL